MPILSDFVQIVGDTPVVIGDSLPGAVATWTETFNTGGRRSDESAFLLFNIRGLRSANTDVGVKVNDILVGHIARYAQTTEQELQNWYTQMIAVSGSTLRNGDNEIKIEGVPANNLLDDFEVKNMVCFFHQSS